MSVEDHGAPRASLAARRVWIAWRIGPAAILAAILVMMAWRGRWDVVAIYAVWLVSLYLYASGLRLTYVTGYHRGAHQAFVDLAEDRPVEDILARAQPHPADPFPTRPEPEP